MSQSTQSFDSKDSILRVLERHGGICDCQTSRDTFVYAASADSRGLEPVTRLLADVVLRPKITDDEVFLARQTVQFELESLNMRPEQDPLLMDMIHAAAYRDNTLGLPKLCPPHNLDKIDRDVLMSYLRLHHNPERMVVAGCGVDHDEFVRHVEKYFGQSATWDREPVTNDSVTAIDTSVAQYTGGSVKVGEWFLYIVRGGWRKQLSFIRICFCCCCYRNSAKFPSMPLLDCQSWRMSS